MPEIGLAYGILRALNIRRVGPDIISCPTCGRCEIDLAGLAVRVEEELRGMKKPIKIALMGCVVNGPGEAAEADIGIAGGKGAGMLFKRGRLSGRSGKRNFFPYCSKRSGRWNKCEGCGVNGGVMRYSAMFLPTGREVPSDAELIQPPVDDPGGPDEKTDQRGLFVSAAGLPGDPQV